jgi:hypothetical protein
MHVPLSFLGMKSHTARRRAGNNNTNNTNNNNNDNNNNNNNNDDNNNNNNSDVSTDAEFLVSIILPSNLCGTQS